MATYVRTMNIPTVSVTDNELKLDCKWTNNYNGGDEAKRMNPCWYINGYWWDHGYGSSVSESANYTCQLDELRSWAAKWKPIKSVQFCVQLVFDGWSSGWYYSPIINLLAPPMPEVTIEHVTENDVPYIEVTVERAESTYNCISLQTRGAVYVNRGNGAQLLTRIEENDETWTHRWPVSQLAPNGADAPIQVIANATAVGLSGNSPEATGRFYISRPNSPRIKSIIANQASLTSAVTINYEANTDASHPVDTVELLRLRDSELSDASAVALVSDDWDGVATTDGKTCSICDVLSDAIPTERGLRTWYRLKATHGTNYTYSLPFELGIYEEPFKLDASGIYIASVEQAEDGASLAVEIAWRDEADDLQSELSKYKLSTEVSWGESPFAWRSTGGAEEFAFDWECDGDEKTQRLEVINENLPEVDGETVEPFTHVAIVYIEDLEESSFVYIKARRCWETESDSGYGDYSNTVAASLSGAGNLVILTAPSTILRGEGIGLLWSLGADVKQSEWLVSGIVAPDDKTMENFSALVSTNLKEAAKAKAALDAACVGLASGYDASGYAVIEAEDLVDVDCVIAKVAVTIGSVTDESAYVLINIANAPVCEVDAPETVTATPASVTVRTSVGSQVALSVISRGISYMTPAGMDYQREGDVAFGGLLSIQDLEITDDGLYEGTVSLEGARLIDGCTYEVRSHVTDPNTGLVSEVATDTFTVEWEHQASEPSASIDVDESKLVAIITPTAPEGAIDTDACDIYRVTPHGADLIAEDITFGSTVTDRFAPYVSSSESAETAYRIALKTKDGDTAFVDVPYMLNSSSIRLDWDEDISIELPYNLKVSEATKKNFKSSTRLDGSRVGSWQEGVEHSGSMDTDLIRFSSDDQRKRIYEVAAFPGPVFVRTPSGLAMETNVEISDVDESYDSGVVGVSLSFEAIDLMDAHRCALDDIREPEDDDG